MVTANALRASARKTLGGNIFANGWLMVLLATLIMNIGVGFGSYVIVGGFLLEGLLGYGLSLGLLFLIRNQKESFDFMDLFAGFSQAGRLLLLGLLKNIFILLWTLLFIVPGVIKAYAYSMAYFIAVDHPEYEWKQCLEASQEMMNGKKGKLFYLDLTFVGWYIVGVLTCGLGVLFVEPYHTTARAHFYEEIREVVA